MDANDALAVIDNLRNYAFSKHLGLLLIGSVAYRSALSNNHIFSQCHDIDCIFIYETLNSLEECPFINERLYNMASQALVNDCDLFSTKKVIRSIQVSLDFVSIDYLCNLADEPITNQHKYRRKLTDAHETKQHIYCDYYGNRICFNKKYVQYRGFRIYKLPIHLFENNNFFPGVLLTKYLYNPVTLVSIKKQNTAITKIQRQVAERCPVGSSMCNFYYRNCDFSSETRDFLENLQFTCCNLDTSDDFIS